MRSSVFVCRVMETRRGRCGEYSRLFFKAMEALNYRARWVVDWEVSHSTISTVSVTIFSSIMPHPFISQRTASCALAYMRASIDATPGFPSQ